MAEGRAARHWSTLSFARAADSATSASTSVAVAPAMTVRNALCLRVFGSRLRATQAASSASFRTFTPAGVMSPEGWFIQWAYFAAIRKMRGFEPPIQIGSGDWNGFGAQSASLIEYRLPA